MPACCLCYGDLVLFQLYIAKDQAYKKELKAAGKKFDADEVDISYELGRPLVDFYKIMTIPDDGPCSGPDMMEGAKAEEENKDETTTEDANLLAYPPGDDAPVKVGSLGYIEEAALHAVFTDVLKVTVFAIDSVEGLEIVEEQFSPIKLTGLRKTSTFRDAMAKFQTTVAEDAAYARYSTISLELFHFVVIDSDVSSFSSPAFLMGMQCRGMCTHCLIHCTLHVRCHMSWVPEISHARVRTSHAMPLQVCNCEVIPWNPHYSSYMASVDDMGEPVCSNCKKRWLGDHQHMPDDGILGDIGHGGAMGGHGGVIPGDIGHGGP